VQICFGKAGWYSYDLLDNLGRPSAEHIIPELQHLQTGDLVPMYQGIGAPEGVGLKVKAIEPERWMLWWDDKTPLDPALAARPLAILNVRGIKRPRGGQRPDDHGPARPRPRGR
jgi:hypothetical protein